MYTNILLYQMKIELDVVEPIDNASSEELAKIILARFGLMPKKVDALARFHRLLLELYEKKKLANKDRKPELAVMTVEEMGVYAGIKRQTMYDYLNRWLLLNVLKKTSFVNDGKIITGYELNGPNIEAAFKKAEYVIQNHMTQTFDIIQKFQNEIKKEKLRQNVGMPDDEATSDSQATQVRDETSAEKEKTE
jgi:hypothetical protein